MQETEPYARIAVWAAPAFVVIVLVVGGIMIIDMIPGGPRPELFLTVGLTLLLIVSGIMGTLHAYRALRYEAETAKE